MPPIGVTLGAIFLDEVVDWKIILGAVLILAGIVAANWSILRRQRVPMAPITPEASCPRLE